MPIKKRSTLPKPKGRGRPSGEFRTPGRALQDLVKEHDKAASDLAWDGRIAEADQHQAKANEYRERIMNGELWEPDF